LIAEIPWLDRRVVGMGWSDQEQLVIVLEDGNSLIYDIHGKLVRNFLLLEAATTVHILECHFWGNGVVAISSDMQLFVAEGLSSADGEAGFRKYTLVSGLSQRNPYTSMAIIPPLIARSGLLEVMLGTSDNSIRVIDENDSEDQLLQDRIQAPITKISVAPNGRFLACFRQDGVLTVLSVTFTTKVLDFDTKSLSRPKEVAWCGEDAVLLVWKNTGIIMVGPYGDWLNYPFDGTVQLVAEPDCCRIITSTSCEMLQRVPTSTEAIRRIGSTDPAALLFDACEGFLEGDPKSDENIRSIASTNQLEHAVQSCINAAAAEFDTSRQQALLRAASYGKAFCQNVDPKEFVETAQKLRVLNDVRRPEIGLPLTIQQYTRLTPEVLVNRLTVRNFHFLALRICDYLKLKNESVLVHWASEKVKRLTATDASDDEISQIIKSKLKDYDRVSYLEVASSAYHMGRRRLATMLLDMEPNPADQVPLLLSMQEEQLALQKAINSEDTDLIYLTLIHLERSRPDIDNFFQLVHAYPMATSLLKVYYRNKVTEKDRRQLHNFLMHNKLYLEAGVACMDQAYMQTAFIGRLELVKEAVQIFGLNSKDLSIYKTMTEEQMDLMEIQKALEVRSGRDFLDLSLSETLYNVFLLGVENPHEASRWNQESSKIIKKFQVSAKMVCSLKVQCYSRAGQWEQLYKLANERKSPIGYKAFAAACVKNGQPEAEAEKYIEKISSSEDKFDVSMELGLYKKAVDVAYRLRDISRMHQVLQSCRNSQLESQIQEMISKF